MYNLIKQSHQYVNDFTLQMGGIFINILHIPGVDPFGTYPPHNGAPRPVESCFLLRSCDVPSVL